MIFMSIVEGELVIEYQYEAAQSFHNGFAAVCVDSSSRNSSVFLTKNIQLYQSPFFQFYRCCPCAGQKRIFVKEQGSWRMIDKKGESVGELTFEDAHCLSEEGYAAVCSNGISNRSFARKTSIFADFKAGSAVSRLLKEYRKPR